MTKRFSQALALLLLMLPLSVGGRGCNDDGNPTAAQQACWAHYQTQINAVNHAYFEQVCLQAR